MMLSLDHRLNISELVRQKKNGALSRMLERQIQPLEPTSGC